MRGGERRRRPAVRRLPCLKVGLTGGIGAGKSLALRAFAEAGARTISLDEVAHALMRRGSPLYRRVLAAFGRDLARGGRIDRRRLGRLAFADPRAKRRLERLSHPAILKEMRRRLKGKRGLCVVDAPVLFEAGVAGEFDLTLLVTAPAALRLKRVVARGGLSAAEARARMRGQWPEARKRRLADVIVPNEGRPQDLKRRITEYHKAFELMMGGAHGKHR